MDLIIENNNNMNEMYKILFEGLDVDNNKYYLKFNYNEEDDFHKVPLNSIQKIIFYNLFMILFSKEDDRYLFEYDKMNYLEILCIPD